MHSNWTSQTARYVIAAILIGLAVGSLCAQTQAPPAPAPRPAQSAIPLPAQKPYTPVAVTISSSARDAALDKLRKDLADIAKRKDKAALAGHIASKDFFWERDFSATFDPKKPSIDNPIAALTLDDDDRSGWESLAAFAAEESAGPLPGRPTIICSPAVPQFNATARDKLLEDSQTDGIEWAYPRASGLAVRAAPDASAAVIDTLALHFVHVLGFEDPKGDSDPIRTAWARVATPAGKTGFTAPGSLLSPYTDRLCFAKAANGSWHIAGYVGGGD